MKESQHGAYGIEFPRPLTEQKRQKSGKNNRELAKIGQRGKL